VADVVIRGLSVAAVDRIDADAAAHGLSRQEYLRRRFEAEGAVAALDRRGRRESSRGSRAPRLPADQAHRVVGLVARHLDGDALRDGTARSRRRAGDAGPRWAL
jgi:hypothetical protein